MQYIYNYSPYTYIQNKKPDLSHLKNVCIKLSKNKKNNIIIFDRTVYPGVTNEYCIPILESKII